MKTSCIRHPESERLILVREWQVVFCEGNHCAAMLMSYFEYWHNIRLEQSERSKRQNDIAEQHQEKRNQDESFYQFHTREDLEAGLLGVYGKSSIDKAIEYLKSKGVISLHSNPNPRYKFDRTQHFRFHPEILNAYLWEGFMPTPPEEPEDPPLDPLFLEDRGSKNKARCSKNKATIPETTTESINSSKEELLNLTKVENQEEEREEIVEKFYSPFIGYFFKKYQEMYGVLPTFGGKEGKLVKKILQACKPKGEETLNYLQGIIDQFFSSKNKFLDEQAGRGLNVFYSVFNQIITTNPSNKNGDRFKDNELNLDLLSNLRNNNL